MPYAEIVPSSCCERHGNVQICIAMYLEPGDARYDEHYVSVPVIPSRGYLGEVDVEGYPTNQAAYNAWIASLPHVMQLNPFHNHFIYGDPSITKAEIRALADFHLPNFYKAWSEGKTMRSGWDVAHRVRPLRYDELDSPEMYALRKEQCETRVRSVKRLHLAGLSLIDGKTSPATALDIGDTADDDRGSTFNLSYHVITLNNPANGTGTIDTIEIWMFNQGGDTTVGTMYHVSNTTYHCRDAHNLGVVTSGSKQTFTSLDIDATAGDFLSAWNDEGYSIERDTSGSASGIVYTSTSSEYIDPDDEGSFPNSQADDAISLYGTGDVFFLPADADHKQAIYIDHDDIDDTLTNFPILLHISASCGRDSEDLSAVFDELTNDANRKKIAVTTSDEVTQCYVEIEKWDDGNEEAWLWVKVPSIASGADTTLYLFYDKDLSDNINYVGDTNDVVAENVWDSNFKAVHHMADGASTSATYDSTSNDKDGAKAGANTPIVTTSGKIGNAQDFSGTTQYITLANSDFEPSAFTIEAWVYPHNVTDNGEIWSKHEGGGAFEGYVFRVGSDEIHLYTGDGSDWEGVSSSGSAVSINSWQHIVVTYDQGVVNLYVDNSSVGSDTIQEYIACDKNPRIGAHATDGTSNEYDGLIDEIRFSVIVRPAEWRKATYETGRDHLLFFTGVTAQAVGQGAVTPAGALGLKIMLGVGDGAITPAGALAAIHRFLQGVGAGAVTPAGALALKIKLAIGSGAVTPAGTLALKIKIAVGSGAITPAGALARKILLAVGSGAITPAGALARKIMLAVGSGAVTPSGTLATIKRFILSVGQGAVTPAGVLARKIMLAVGSGAITPTGAIGLLTKIAVGAGSITPTGALSTIRKIFQSVGQGVITPIGALGRKILLKVGSGAITPTGVLATIRSIFQSVGQGAVTPTGALSRVIKILMGSGSITPVGTLGRLIKISVGAGVITPIGSLIRYIVRKVLSLMIRQRPYRDLIIQVRPYRDLVAEARAYRDLTAQARAYRDLVVEARPHRELKLEIRG